MSVAQERSAEVFMYGRDFRGEPSASGLDGITFDYRDVDCVIRDLHTSLPGEHQISNACLAVKTALLALKGDLAPGGGRRIDAISAIRKGLAEARWRGRLEMVRSDPAIMIDGAHNPDAALALAAFIKDHLADRRIILVVGIMSDKDIEGILARLLPVASEVVFTAPAYGRSAPPQRLAKCASEMGFLRFHCTHGIRAALETAGTLYSEHAAHGLPLIIITGSFYTIGEAMEVLGERPVLGTLRETL